MIVIAGLIIAGIILGFAVARHRRGNRLDRAQYAAIPAILFGVIGMFPTIAPNRAAT